MLLTATRTNASLIGSGKVEIRQASVAELPFSDGMFDLVTAVETHFWWPNLPDDMREVRRVVKPGGTLIVIAEIYKGATTKIGKMADKVLPQSGMKLLTVDEHRELLENAGFRDVRVNVEASKGWICAIGKKP